MSTHLQGIADAITSAAGWKSASPDKGGVFRFSVENGLDFQLLTPEGRTAVLLADLGAAPAQGDTQGDEELKRLASVAAASLKKRRSSFAVAGSRLELSRTFPMLVEEREIRLIVRDFLNDLAPRATAPEIRRLFLGRSLVFFCISNRLCLFLFLRQWLLFGRFRLSCLSALRKFTDPYKRDLLFKLRYAEKHAFG